MNIFELIAVGIICLTVLAVCLIATKHPLTIKHTYIYTPVEQTTQPVEHKQDTKSTAPEKTNADIEKEINEQRKSRYLPNIVIPNKIKCYSDFENVIIGSRSNQAFYTNFAHLIGKFVQVYR